MPSQHSAGTLSATSIVIGTANFLGADPDTTAGIFSFMVDLINMQRNDAVELKFYEKTTGTSDSAREFQCVHFIGEQGSAAFFSPGWPLLHGWRFSLNQAAGSARDFKWSIRKS